MGCCSSAAAQADEIRNSPLDSLNSPTPTQCAFESESQSSPRSPPLPQSTEHPLLSNAAHSSLNSGAEPQDNMHTQERAAGNSEGTLSSEAVQCGAAEERLERPSAAGIITLPTGTRGNPTQQPMSLEMVGGPGQECAEGESPIDHTYSNPLGLPVELMYQSANHHGQMQDMYSQQGTSTPPSRSYNSGELLHASTDALAAGLGFSPSPLMAVLGRGVREQEADRTVSLVADPT